MWLTILKAKPKSVNSVSFPQSSVNSRNNDQHLKWSSKQNCSSFQVTLIWYRIAKIVSDVYLFYVALIYCVVWITEQQLAQSLFSVPVELKMLATGCQIRDNGKERWDSWWFYRSLTEEEIGGTGSERYPRSGMGRTVERACPHGSWSWASRNAQSFEHGWEKTQEEEQQLSHSPNKPWVYRHKGTHLGIRQRATAPCHGLSLPNAVNTIIYTTWSGERQVCKPVLWAPRNMRILSQASIRILPTTRSSVTKLVSVSFLCECSFQKSEHTATSQWGPILI